MERGCFTCANLGAKGVDEESREVLIRGQRVKVTWEEEALFLAGQRRPSGARGQQLPGSWEAETSRFASSSRPTFSSLKRHCGSHLSV